MAIFRARGGTSLTTLPPISTSPEVCTSKPATIRSRVVLPQPLGPSRTRNSPSVVARSTPSTAVESPNRFTIFRVSTIATSNQLAIMPLGPDPLTLRLRLFDRVLGAHRTGARLREHRIQHPGIEALVHRCGGVTRVAHVGRPIRRIQQYLVLVRGLGF